MKHLRRINRFILAALVLGQAFSITAATFTSDTYIGPTDFSNDGQDIVVTNCTVTVDGAHGFNSLQIQNAGVLTHSAFTNGPLQITNIVAGEVQILSAAIPATLLNTNVDTNTIMVMDSSGTITYAPDVDYVVTDSNQYTELTLTTNSAIAEGTNVLVNYTWYQNYQGFSLTISNDMQVLAGGAVNVQGKGYAGGNGPGAGASQPTNYPYTFTTGAGGAHGGCGGMSFTFALGGASYDSTTNPASLGSGGGAGATNGGAGGGLAQLFVGGLLQVDGQISADGLKGTNRYSGGGAGGGILISAQSISGAGSITANGGGGDLPDGGGGGGGLITIYSGIGEFTGSISAIGGAGNAYGGAGTIFTQSFSSPAGQLLIANGGTAGTNTIFYSNAAISNLTISGGAVAQSGGFTISNLFIGSNSALVPVAPGSLIMTINGNATVDSNAVINADAQTLSGIGSGFDGCGAGTGGGYGGFGGASAGCTRHGGGAYGSIAQPSSLGSPGLGVGIASPGAGAIQMTVAGTLLVSGKIVADGASAVPGSVTGGGSGGSVWLNVQTIAGTGVISANGGAADPLAGGGGGGGRIAVYTVTTNLFPGIMTAHGGAGANAGGPGTVYVQTDGNPFAQLTVDNAGLPGFSSSAILNPCDLTISGGATLTNTSLGTMVLQNLTIGSNSWLSLSPSSNPSLTITATNVTIQASGGISGDGASASFQGAGQTTVQNSVFSGGGGGNAGFGGSSFLGSTGGVILTTLNASPTAGGIGGQGQNGLGGDGGAVVNLNVAARLQLDGSITANGVSGPSVNSGGGAGGTVLLNAGTFAGAGTISANGGTANPISGGGGGGGGGGRVIINSRTNLFSGIMTARGGAGANIGGAGILFVSSHQVTVDNGGMHGAMTPLNSSGMGIFDLSVTGAAVVSNSYSGSISFGNFLIGSNSTLLSLFSSTQTFTIFSNNATIQAGGLFSADGANTTASVGQGQSLNNTGGGGSYGGTGGTSFLNATGGPPILDTINSPSSLGGRGGVGTNQLPGGNGGGSLYISVENRLQLDGRISAQGFAGVGTNSGGGAGGSVNLRVGTLTGSGTISVNGGAAGPFGLGGGGGGGRIAVYCVFNSNAFTGTLTAYGGPGANSGGAGTVYTSIPTVQSRIPQFIVDNGGANGLTTANYYADSSAVTVINGATLNNSVVSPAFQTMLVGSNSAFLSQGNITINSNLTIQAGGKFANDGIGTAGGGQTVNQTGGGGAHGGYGGASLSNALGGNVLTDAITQPTFMGTRGGAGPAGTVGANGGGAFHLTVNGTLQLGGKLSADGAASTNLNGGGGGGGAVWLTLGTLSGAGTISANGGAANGVGGGGGGGRIAVSYQSSTFSGSFAAHGGSGANFGGAGTISIIPAGQPSQLIIDNNGARGTNTYVAGIPTTANVSINSGASVTLTGLNTWNSLSIASNGVLTTQPNVPVLLTISGDLAIQPGGAIFLDGEGSLPNTGTGWGQYSPFSGGGGGHGGYGSSGVNAAGGLSYDSITAPTQTGSGGGSPSSSGPGSTGGGALQLTVGGNLIVGGKITANGVSATSAGAGGGAGGSIWINANTLSGSGKISADGGGGDVSSSGGGAGGRVALYFNSDGFTGVLSAHGGAGVGLAGGAGTIFLQTNSSSIGQLVIDNAGTLGTNTPIASMSSVSPAAALLLLNGAQADSTVPLTFQNISITSGSGFNADNLAPLNLTVLGDALVDSNSYVIADDAGYNSGSNTVGSGSVDIFGDGGGGGYGGTGAESVYGAFGGGTYGSSNQPVDFGSAGGTSPGIGGFSQGGGAIRLLIDGNLTLNGTVSANGNDGVIEGSGGGSGGSIWITASSIAGAGNITANGGTGQDAEGGGGGGGRIAVYANNNAFTGNAGAQGGTGFSTGQPGTVVFATNLLVSGSITDTNGVGISGLTLQPDGLASVSTDGSGNYSVATPIFWSGNITPTSAGFYIPNLRSYSSVSSNVPNQNFILALPSDFNFSGSQFDGTNNASFSWYGINGISYQPLCSSNLLDWAPYGSAIIGTNGPAMFLVPVSNAPQLFFRLNVSY